MQKYTQHIYYIIYNKFSQEKLKGVLFLISVKVEMFCFIFKIRFIIFTKKKINDILIKISIS